MQNKLSWPIAIYGFDISAIDLSFLSAPSEIGTAFILYKVNDIVVIVQGIFI